MACKTEVQPLMDKVLDREATEEEEQRFLQHMHECPTCRLEFEQLKFATEKVSGLEEHLPPKHFTEAVMAGLPAKPVKKHSFLEMIKRYPLLTAAALFIILMSGYFFSEWTSSSFEAVVQGKGHLIYKGNTVIVPKGETIKGDLIVKNGHAQIDGKVEGDVILINSDKLLASAGQVTGDIEHINQIMAWIWYKIKQGVSHLTSFTAIMHTDRLSP